MIAIKDSLVSEDLLEKQFVCDLTACKGACCVEGDAGAPVEATEAERLEEDYQQIAPFLREEGKQVIAKAGVVEVDPADGELVTPLVNNAECAYVVFESDGTTKCGIEKAWEAGATQFRKPVSCHLYPIRITRYPSYDAVNYHKWQICDPACSLGASLKVPVYRFAREGLIRKYGSAWYDELAEVAEHWPES